VSFFNQPADKDLDKPEGGVPPFSTNAEIKRVRGKRSGKVNTILFLEGGKTLVLDLLYGRGRIGKRNKGGRGKKVKGFRGGN